MDSEVRKAIATKLKFFGDAKSFGLKFDQNKSCKGCHRALVRTYANEISFCSGITNDTLDIIMFCVAKGTDVVDMKAMHIVEAFDTVVLLSVAIGGVFDHLSQKDFLDVNMKAVKNIFKSNGNKRLRT